jgi:hypothetical protein
VRIHLDLSVPAAGAPVRDARDAARDDALPAAGTEPTAIREIARETSRVHEVAPGSYLIAFVAGCAALLAGHLAGAGLTAEQRIGIIFAAVFAWLLAFGVVGSGARRLRRRRAAAAAAGEAWRLERDWPDDGIGDAVAARGWRLLGIVACIALVLAPFHMLVPLVHGESGVWVLYLVLALFDLAAVVMTAAALRTLGRCLRYGKTRVRLGELPALTGRDMIVTFEAARALRGRSDLRADLLCIREEMNARAGGESASRVHAVLYEEARRFTTDSSGWAKLAFRVPPDAPGTSLLRESYVYWELVVTTTSPDDDYEGVFLLPVYRRSPGAHDSMGCALPEPTPYPRVEIAPVTGR